MRTRQLGDSDLHVSEISLGSWLTYSGGIERDQTEACTKAAFDAGITFFDTANVYGTGAAETAWGEILKDYPRDSYILATKVFFPMSSYDRGLSGPQIRRQIDASLKRLQTEYVDLYQCHRFDAEIPIEETMAALTEVVDSGKARWIGFSEWTPEQIEAGLAVADATKFVSSQPQYSMLWQAPEAEVFGAVRRQRDLAGRVVAARRGRADRQVQAGRAAAVGLARGQRLDEHVHRPAADRRHAQRGCRASSRSPTRRGCRWPSWRWRGCCAATRSRRRSSARRGPSRCTRTSRRAGTSCPTTC